MSLRNFFQALVRVLVCTFGGILIGGVTIGVFPETDHPVVTYVFVLGGMFIGLMWAYRHDRYFGRIPETTVDEGKVMNQTEFYQAKLNYETDSWDLYEALNNGEPIVVIDARSAEAYTLEHIPTSINIPHRTMSEATTNGLDKSKVYVTYCDGIGCNASTKGALNMAKLGFQVKELMGGLDWWKRDGYETKGKQGVPGSQVVCGC